MQETQETWVQSLGGVDSLEKEMATHCSIFAWRIPWTEKPSRLQSMGSQRVRQDWMTNTFTTILHDVRLVECEDVEPQTQRIWFCLSTNGESWTSFSCYMEKDVFYVLYFWHRYNVCMFNYFWYHTCQRWKERYLEELLLRNFFVFLQNYISPTCILREWMVVGIYNSLND